MSAITPLAIITAMHVVGLIALLWGAFAYGGRPPDEGGEGGDGRGGLPKTPSGRPTGGPPLADAQPSRVRLRGPGRLGDLAPSPRVRRGPVPRPSAPGRPRPARAPDLVP